jgi:hypothetical protein
MTLRYNRTVAIIMLILAVINVVLGLWLVLLGSRSILSLFLAVVIGFVAYGYFTKPYLLVEQNEIVLPALLGPARRSYSFRTPDDVKFEDNKLFVRNGERWKRVPVYRWLSDPEGWAALKQRFTRA